MPALSTYQALYSLTGCRIIVLLSRKNAATSKCLHGAPIMHRAFSIAFCIDMITLPFWLLFCGFVVLLPLRRGAGLVAGYSSPKGVYPSDSLSYSAGFCSVWPKSLYHDPSLYQAYVPYAYSHHSALLGIFAFVIVVSVLLLLIIFPYTFNIIHGNVKCKKKIIMRQFFFCRGVSPSRFP